MKEERATNGEEPSILGEPISERKPIAYERANIFRSKPMNESEPEPMSKPTIVSEPKARRKPKSASEPSTFSVGKANKRAELYEREEGNE